MENIIQENSIKASTIAALSNPFSTGGGGVDFEHRVQATFLLALLVEGFSPLLGLPITSIDFQAKRQGYDTDDFVVMSSKNGHVSKLLCQIKHGIQITENETFQKVISAAWCDFKKTEFNKQRDKIVIITNPITNANTNALRFIYDQANSASNSEDFLDRINRLGYSNQTKRDKLKIIKKYLQEANNSQALTADELWEFCKVFTILVFDLDYESSVNEFLIHALITSNSKEDAPSVWGQLVDLAGRYDRSAKHVEFCDIPDFIKDKFKNINDNFDNIANSFDFSTDLFWAKLSLVGSWKEENEFDKHFLESFLDLKYSEIRHKAQEKASAPNSTISFDNGLWHINHRRSMVETSSNFYYDDIVKKLFELSIQVFKEEDKRLQEDNKFNIIMYATEPFNYSEALRNGILHGIAILCNISEDRVPCSDGMVNFESTNFIQKLLNNSNEMVWMSLDAYLPTLAEINPTEYLHSLEQQIINNPNSIETLFPKKDSNLLFARNSICSILWSLECLAWDEKYFVKCIRLLGMLAGLGFEKTNLSNTPINSIVTIMLPWHIQTLASIEKQKNAIKALQIECSDVAWDVIMKLLPNATTVTGGTQKPKYIMPILSKEITTPQQDMVELYSYYSNLALTLAKEDYYKLRDLLSNNDDMDCETITAYLRTIIEQSDNWDDSQKYPFWDKLLDKKTWIIHNVKEKLNESMMELLSCAIEKTYPNDIRYSHKRLYSSNCFDYDESGEFESKWHKQKELQESAVYEIFSTYGVSSVVQFGKELNEELWVAQNLGKKLKEKDVNMLISLGYRAEIDKDFLVSAINGYVIVNNYDSIEKLDFKKYPADYISSILSHIYPSMELFEIAEHLLEDNINLFWKYLSIPRLGLHDNINTQYVWEHLVDCERFAAAVNLFGITAKYCNISHMEISFVLKQAAINESNDSLDPSAVRNLIGFLHQNNDKKTESIIDISDIELIYLPWLDDCSKVKPKALSYRLANEPKFFCELIKMFYKKAHAETHENVISDNMIKRLSEIFFNYNIVPGTDWDGNYDNTVFLEWVNYCKKWAKEEDREAVVLHTIGNGLSYAKRDEKGLIAEFIMAELNKADNEEMRKGYRLGVYNQRGATWIDPEGKPEFALAEKYNKMAEEAESLGYANYAETLRMIADTYINEAKRNIKEYKQEKEEEEI